MPTIRHLATRPAYTESIRDGINDPGERGNLHPRAADISIRRGINTYRCTVDVSPYGAITLTRPTTGRTVRFEPYKDTLPKHVTERQAEDLALVADRADSSNAARMAADGSERIAAGFLSLPPSAAERLLARGWLSTTGEPGALVTVSVAGHLAMARHAAVQAGAAAGEYPALYADAVRAFAAVVHRVTV